jgi:tetratricopeptide (TPR) repeat protein
LKAALRSGGDLDLIKRFVAAGFPVLIEKGTILRDYTGKNSWMGHYAVVDGYDESRTVFNTQDAFVGANFEVPYDVLQSNWRSFNYTYLIIYPPEREAEVMALLGPDAEETANWQNAALKASDEIYATEGLDHYFAWFNRGTSLVNLQDFAGAATAYDEAFNYYPSLPEEGRPWRMLWYQTGPYFAYFYTGRYYDVLNLANTTLDAMQSDKNLEETYYWRAMAKNALGDSSGAVEDFRESLKFHAGFPPPLAQLQALGIEP